MNEDAPVGLPFFYNFLSGHSNAVRGIRTSALGQMFTEQALAPECGRRAFVVTRYVIRRLGLSLITLLLLVTIVFLIVNVLPSTRTQHPRPLRPAVAVDAVNEEIGFNDPKLTQFGRLVKETFTFDFGESYQFKRPVSDLLWPALGRSAKLVGLALVMTVPLAIAAGFFAARRRNTVADRSVVTLGLASSSIPDFVSGVTLQYLLGVKLGWFPVLALAPEGSGPLTTIDHLMLPALAIVCVYFGYIARMTRAGTIQALDADYTRTAVMKGLGRRSMMRRHVTRNALQPTVSVIGIQIGYMFAGLVALERIFNYPGLGNLIYQAASKKDFPLLSAAVILVGIIYMVVHVGGRSDDRLDEPTRPAGGELSL